MHYGSSVHNHIANNWERYFGFQYSEGVCERSNLRSESFHSRWESNIVAALSSTYGDMESRSDSQGFKTWRDCTRQQRRLGETSRSDITNPAGAMLVLLTQAPDESSKWETCSSASPSTNHDNTSIPQNHSICPSLTIRSSEGDEQNDCYPGSFLLTRTIPMEVLVI